MYRTGYFLEEETKYTMVGKRLEQKLPQVFELIKKEYDVTATDKIGIELEEYFPVTYKEIWADVKEEYEQWLEQQELGADPFDAGNYLKREI